jgi:hypothetical protein
VQPAVTPPSATVIPPGTTLPFNRISAVVVDGGDGQVFVAGSNSSSESGVVVMYDDGSIRQVLTSETNALGLALFNGKLYISRCASDVVDVIDASTLASVESIPNTLADGYCQLAVAGGRLWFTAQDAHPLKAMDLASPHTVQAYDLTGGGLHRLATARNNPDGLALTNSNSPTTTEIYDVGGASPVLLNSANSIGGDISLSDDGSELTAGASGGVTVFDVATMTPSVTYAVPANAVAVASNGTVATAYSTYPAFMNIYGPDQASTPVRTWKYGSSSSSQGGIADRSIRFSDDGSKLFVLTDDGQFHVITSPGLPAPNLTVTAASTTVKFNGHTTITVHLTGSHTNRTVKLYRTPTDSARVLVKTATVGPKGNLEVVTPSLGRNNTFVAEYAGDAAVGWGTSNAVRVKVRVAATIAAQGFYGRSGAYRLFHYHSTCPSRSSGCPFFVGHVNPPKPGDYVTFTIQHRSASGSWRKIATGTFKLGKSSNAAVVFQYPGTGAKLGYWRINMAARGDNLNTGNTTSWLYFRITN